MSKKGTTESFPFNETTLVFKVMNKIYLLTNLEGEFSVSMKCDPKQALELREEYSFIVPAYHMNKKHWNSLFINGLLPQKLVHDLVDHSYDLVFNGLPKKTRDLLQNA